MVKIMKKYALPVFIIAVLLSLGAFYFCNSEAKAGKSVSADLSVWPSLVSASDTVYRRIEAADAPIESEFQQASFAENVLEISNDELDVISEKYSAVGVQCAVIENGFVTGSYVFGLADRESGKAVTQNTKYRVASLSKLFTNMIFMALVDSGRASLDADISDYYGFSVRNPAYPDTPITPRMLMTHTASVADGRLFDISLGNASSISIKQLLTDRSTFFAYKPGSAHSYSNLSNALVGSVCELASGVCFEELAQSLFLDPLQLDGGYLPVSVENAEEIGVLYDGDSAVKPLLSTRFHPVLGQTVHLTQGNLIISATDYAQLLCVLLNDGCAADGTRLLSKKSVAELLRVQFNNGGELVGLGSFIYEGAVEDRTVYAHTGSAYGMYACFLFDPAAKDGVVVLTSGARYETDPQTGIYSICAELIRALLPQ